MPLTDDAKAELREAIRIVREDRFEGFARGLLSKSAPKEPLKDPLIDPEPEKDPVPAPPAKDPTKDPEPPKTRKSGYWGELMDE